MTVNTRVARASDAAAIAGIYRPYVERSHFTFEEVAPEATEIASRMANPIHPWLVAEEDGVVVGYASSSPLRNRAAYRWSLETGVYLAGGAQGRGIGSRLLEAHLELLERQGFVTAIAGIALPNEPSVALHEKLGFTLLGIERGVGFKLGRWVDVGRWQRDLARRTRSPREPSQAAQAAQAASSSGFSSAAGIAGAGRENS
ncbi:MAG TPA: GNAT family N-acetyltransferase [Sphingomicrobium sp.]|nr:GNAT family N-acetyltransferase [Sphingomicrobium sp.]